MLAPSHSIECLHSYLISQVEDLTELETYQSFFGRYLVMKSLDVK